MRPFFNVLALDSPLLHHNFYRLSHPLILQKQIQRRCYIALSKTFTPDGNSYPKVWTDLRLALDSGRLQHQSTIRVN